MLGSSGMVGLGSDSFPSCECIDDDETDGDGVGGGRCVSVLIGPLMFWRGRRDKLMGESEGGKGDVIWTSVEAGKRPARRW